MEGVEPLFVGQFESLTQGTFEKRLERMRSRGQAFQAEGTASAKTLTKYLICLFIEKKGGSYSTRVTRKQ